MVVSTDRLFNDALERQDAFWDLWQVAKRLLDEGWEHETLLAAMEQYRTKLQREKRDSDEDTVLDVMDCLVGFSNPQKRP